MKETKCIDCKKFTHKTRFCSWLQAFIDSDLAKKNIPCDGYE